MKSFFKMLLASCLGVFIAGFVGFFLSIGILAGMLASMGSSSKTVYTLSDNTVLQLDLSGSISDRKSSDFFSGLFDSSNKSSGLDDILKAIKTAKENDKVQGIYIKSGGMQTGFGSLEPLRKALIDFKESGKFVVAYADNYSQGAYYISSVADKVVLNPQGMFMLHGMAANLQFLKGTFEKLGIKYEVFKVGTFKSAVEPYTETKMSDANREQVTSYVNSIWSHLLKGVSESRNISIEDLNRYADEYMDFSAAEKSVEYGLVDTLMYVPEVKDYLKKLTGLGEDDKIKFATVANLNSVPSKKLKIHKDKIAVLYAEGEIVTGENKGIGYMQGNVITDEQFVKELVKLKEDENVKAVVFRVNSPGGSAYASEQIWREVIELKKLKPVIVSMGDVAASGGYYISCAADMILAEPTTITGSIGGFAMIPQVEELNKKIGMTYDGVKTNKYSDMLSTDGLVGGKIKAFTADEKQIIQAYTNRFVDVFYTRCAEGRSKTKDEIDAIGQGRVWTGAQALQNGLIDKLGSLNDAIEIAAQRAELTEYDVTSHPKKKEPFSQLMEELTSGDLKAGLVKTFFGNDIFTQYMISKGKLAPMDIIQARLIETLE